MRAHYRDETSTEGREIAAIMDNQRLGSARAPIRVLFEAGSVVGQSDGELLDQFASGAPEQAEPAFAAVVERHGPLVLRVARRILRDPDEADDVFQATFLILARRAGSIRRRESLAAWLHGVAAHVARASRSAAQRRRAHEARAGTLHPGSTPAPAPPADDLGAIVIEELGRLPERYRTAVILCCLQGLTQQEAAEQVGWPLGTLQSRLARGRSRLRVGLTRRGLAPAVAAAAAALTPASVPAAVPTRLARSTVQLATQGGTVPPALQFLVSRGVRAMALTQWKTAALTLSLAAGLIGTGAGAWALQHGPPAPVAAAIPAPTQVAATNADDDGLLTVTGTVVLPDGSPAPGATVAAIAPQPGSAPTTRTDAAGRFTLRGLFDNSGRLHAQLNDGRLQAVRTVAEGDVRTAFAHPVELRLAAAESHPVLVLADGQPVAGATVVAQGTSGIVQSQTGTDGRAGLAWLPGEQPDDVVAWHPNRGVNAVKLGQGRPLDPTIQITLRPRRPQTVRAVDGAGRGVAGLELAVNFLPEDVAQTRAWIATGAIAAAHVRTDAEGVAVVPWAPDRSLRFTNVQLLGSDWKIDATDQGQPAERLTTIHVRPERAVTGRLVMPDGASAEGIAITGFGFGPQNQGAIPYARARRDGTFTLRVPADHGFVLGVLDSEWASDPWTGPILLNEQATPAEITILVYPATPLTVRVTRGEAHEPVANAFVHIGVQTEFSWTDAAGQKRNGTGGPTSWTKTDARGLVHAGVGRGKQHIRLSSPTWNEGQTVRITTSEPQTVEFSRPWVGTRRIAGRLTTGSGPYRPAPTLTLRAWVIEANQQPERIDLPVRPDGTFEVVRDAAAIQVLAHDPAGRQAGSASIPRDATTLDLPLQPTATYGGALVDEQGQPMADQAVEILVKSIRSEAVAATRTDAQGRFRFPSVPANTPLEIFLKHDKEADWSQFVFANGLLFEPGEIRLDAQLNAQWAYGGGESTPPPRPGAAQLPALAESVATTTGNARVTGLQALAVIWGDGSGPVAQVAAGVLDDDRVAAVLGYLPIQLKPDRARAEAAPLAGLGWPTAEPGEVVLAVLDAAGKPTATERLTSADPAAAIRRGDQFLQAHRPPTHDALVLIAAARSEAQATRRRVWLVLGGPRCGPCFTLARWIDEHRSVLERDYVVVKIMAGLDDHVHEATARLPIQPGEGIPWFAITDPDGTVRATSVGPLGNMGCPTSVEDLRHFRAMLDATRRTLTPADVDTLIQSRAAGR